MKKNRLFTHCEAAFWQPPSMYITPIISHGLPNVAKTKHGSFSLTERRAPMVELAACPVMSISMQLLMPEVLMTGQPTPKNLHPPPPENLAVLRAHYYNHWLISHKQIGGFDDLMELLTQLS